MAELPYLITFRAEYVVSKFQRLRSYRWGAQAGGAYAGGWGWWALWLLFVTVDVVLGGACAHAGEGISEVGFRVYGGVVGVRVFSEIDLRPRCGAQQTRGAWGCEGISCCRSFLGSSGLYMYSVICGLGRLSNEHGTSPERRLVEQNELDSTLADI